MDLEILREYRFLIILTHVLSAAIGVGSATVTDVLFFKFLKDYRISKWEASIMNILSGVIWVVLIIAILSGGLLYFLDAERLNASPKFLVKVIIVAVILLNGIFLNFYIAPKLNKISFGKKHQHRAGELHYERKLAFAGGAVSIISWYSAFVLGMMKTSPAGFLEILSGYLVLLVVGIVGSQIMEKILDKKASYE